MKHGEYVEYLVSIGHDRATAQTMANAYSGLKPTMVKKHRNRFQQANMTRQERMGSATAGLFLMCFGAPFVVLPGMMWFDINGSFDPVVLCFTSPFIFAGGLVIAMGGNLLLSSIRGVQGMVWIEDGGEDETQAVGEGTAETSRPRTVKPTPTHRPPTRRWRTSPTEPETKVQTLQAPSKRPMFRRHRPRMSADVGTGAFGATFQRLTMRTEIQHELKRRYRRPSPVVASIDRTAEAARPTRTCRSSRAGVEAPPRGRRDAGRGCWP